jgi:hypothetical protein
VRPSAVLTWSRASESRSPARGDAPAPARDTDDAIVGPPDHWTEVLTHLALDLGFGTFVLIGQPDPQMLRTFIEDVAHGSASAARRRVPSRRSPEYGEGPP